MGLFDNGHEANVRSVVAMVEDVLEELGQRVATVRVRAMRDEQYAWQVAQGSATVRIAIIARDENAHLRVISTVMTLDEDVNEVALYRHLLALNRKSLFSMAFALDGRFVDLISERPTLDLDRGEVRDLIHRVAICADEYDDILVAEFGGTLGHNTSLL